MTEPEHFPAIRRIDRVLTAMRHPTSPLRTMKSADGAPPCVPAALDLRLCDQAALRERLAAGAVKEVRRGVYMPRSDVDAYEDAILAEVRGLVDGTSAPFLFSHVTAALLHGSWTYRIPVLVHVTQESNPHVARDDEPLVRRHHTTLRATERTTVLGFPVTSLERTLVDCIRMLPRDSALVACDSLFRLGAEPEEVSRIVTASAGKRGIVQARQVLELCDPRSASPGESLTRLAAMDVGLPRPECQLQVATSNGSYFADIGWDDVGVIVEFDGDLKYAGDEAEVRREESERQRALERAGWIVVRVRWEDLADPIALEQRIRAAYLVGQRRARLRTA